MSDGFFPLYSPVFDFIPTAALNGSAASGCFQSLTINNNTVRAADVRAMLHLQFSGTPAVGAEVQIYLAGAHRTGATALTDRLDTSQVPGTQVYNITYSKLLAVISVPSTSSPRISWEASLLDIVSSLPPLFSLVLCNYTGVAVNSASGANSFTGVFVNYGYA